MELSSPDVRYPMMRDYTSPLKKAERPIIGRDREMRSLRAAMMRPELCNVILLGEAGSGKAHPLTEWIPVDDDRRFVRLGDLAVGDRVFDEHGFAETVTGIFPQGDKRLFEVVFSDGSVVSCNDEHLWNVRPEGNESAVFETVTLRTLMNWQQAAAESVDEPVFWEVPASKPLRRDGSMDQLPAERMARESYLFDCVWRILAGMPLPGRMMLCSVAERMELLNALFDKLSSQNRMEIEQQEDGSCNMALFFDRRSPGHSFCVSPSGSLRELLWSLGLRHVYRQVSDSLDVLVLYSVRVDGGFLCQDASGLSITEIRDTGQDVPMACIMVNGVSHLYQVGRSGVVTHNTALVQGTMLVDTERDYLEVDLAKMISNLNDKNEMAARLKSLFDEVAACVREKDRDIVLFIDEFHQIIQLSEAAVEALKPLLADSGTRRIRVIAATTYVEFRRWIAPNQSLVERLQRINLVQPGKETVIAILKDMAKRYGVGSQFYNDHLYEMIYEYTNRYIPANSQPRKSILLLDSMIGWHKAEHRRMDMRLLSDVIYESEGVNVAFRVDATKIKRELDARVFAQDLATRMIANRLQSAVAGLNDDEKPLASFLFCGSTGVGKTEVSKQLARVMFDDDRSLIRMDMTEYANEDSLNRFRSELTNAIWEHPYSVVLLDEVEKACAPVTRILLQVLDDGRLIDDNNREVSFLNCYVIMTTNAGSEIFKNIAQYNVDDAGSGAQLKDYDKLIRKSIISTAGGGKFPPELMGRIDTMVPFQPLSEETMKRITKLKLKQLRDRVMKKHNILLEIDQKVIQYLVEDELDTDSDSGGARNVIHKMEAEVVTAVATYINQHPGISKLGVMVEGTLASDDKYKLKSSARIVVEQIA